MTPNIVNYNLTQLATYSRWLDDIDPNIQSKSEWIDSLRQYSPDLTWSSAFKALHEQISNYEWTQDDIDSFVQVYSNSSPSPIEPNDILSLVSFMIDIDISPAIVILSTPSWATYLVSISEPNIEQDLRHIVSLNKPDMVLKFYRAFYKYGISLMPDQYYDSIEKLYLTYFEETQYLANQTYDDDILEPEILQALEKHQPDTTPIEEDTTPIEEDTPNSEVNRILFDELNADKSKSVRPVENIEEVYQFINSVSNCDVMFSLKIDGINVKVLFGEDNSGLKLALSRGRASDSFDYTKTIQSHFSLSHIDTTTITGSLTCEAFVTKEGVNQINSHSNEKNYKTPKSAGAAMLRSPQNFSKEDLKWLRTMFFNYNGLLANKSYEELQSKGLETPPNIIVSRDDIPNNLEDFKKWLLDDIMEQLYEIGNQLDLPSDGVVLDLLTNNVAERDDKYSNKNIALKFGRWSASSYYSKVIGIEVEQKRTEASVVLLIEPTVTRDYNTATRVGGISTAILVNDNVRVGDTIEFVRKSEAYNTYVRKINREET